MPLKDEGPQDFTAEQRALFAQLAQDPGAKHDPAHCIACQKPMEPIRKPPNWFCIPCWLTLVESVPDLANARKIHNLLFRTAEKWIISQDRMIHDRNNLFLGHMDELLQMQEPGKPINDYAQDLKDLGLDPIE